MIEKKKERKKEKTPIHLRWGSQILLSVNFFIVFFNNNDNYINKKNLEKTFHITISCVSI